jgi:xanthine dehydrogenase YagT iron-sulfur-binding subunit
MAQLSTSLDAQPLSPGDTVPDAPIALPDGDTRSLSQFRGSPVIVALHAPQWDPSHREQIAAYNRLIASLPDAAGAQLLSAGGDGLWRDFVFDDYAIALPVIKLTNDELALRFGVRGEPAIFVIDRDGVVRWRHVGPDTPDPGDIIRALTDVAKSPPATLADNWSRRQFVATALGVVFALTIRPHIARGETIARAVSSYTATTRVTLNINGKDVTLQLEPRVTLLDALREYAGLAGTKKGCDHGQCGACTVHIDGRRTLSCLTFAVMQQSKQITTIEGLAHGDDLHPLQQAFVTHDGFQCGYCTSGQIMSAAGMLNEPWGPRDDDVREAMSGNICRCGAYPGIVAAIQDVRQSGRAAR